MNLLAQIEPSTGPLIINQGNTLYRVTDLGLLITRILNVAGSIVGLLILAYLIWGGLDWVLAGEDKGKVESARAKITQGVIGLAVFFTVFALYFILTRFLGIGNHITIGGV